MSCAIDREISDGSRTSVEEPTALVPKWTGVGDDPQVLSRRQSCRSFLLTARKIVQEASRAPP
ncbi:hypothetical protein RB3654 [Rhodopirellula baltica SH 1]|uniref:Uncharacterized protein n=1 Tax=Rhodopirellula baltica (strain DSM 10527 / NCIMB 13988 / SH1) TaxID=243090 RepID=Q7UTW2_RHOBA|nr:hypothetical protein RB3654 [Rhodopirellula baltica SH 1]